MTELSIHSDTARKWYHWWPLLLGPGVFALTYLANAQGWQWFLAKENHEVAAYLLLAIVIITCIARYAAGRNPWHLLLAVLAGIFLLREWKTHLEISAIGLKTGAWVFVLIGAWGVWAWLWRQRLAVLARTGQFWLWLCCTGWTYILSQMMSRRAFRFLPMEQQLHVTMEEAVENMAHLMLLIVALVGCCRCGKGDRV